MLYNLQNYLYNLQISGQKGLTEGFQKGLLVQGVTTNSGIIIVLCQLQSIINICLRMNLTIVNMFKEAVYLYEKILLNE
jgi:hypothetical protein